MGKYSRQLYPRGLDHESDQEVRRSRRSPFPKSFGIRQLLVQSQCCLILESLAKLQAEDDIPRAVRLRDSLHATLLPRRVFGRQVLKGLAAGYNLRALQNKLDVISSSPMTTEADEATIERATVRKSKVINLVISCPEIEARRKGVSNIMEGIGLRGLHRAAGEVNLHVSLGDSKRQLTPTEQRHIEHIVPETIQAAFEAQKMEPVLLFDPAIQFYPDLGQWAR